MACMENTLDTFLPHAYKTGIRADCALRFIADAARNSRSFPETWGSYNHRLATTKADENQRERGGPKDGQKVPRLDDAIALLEAAGITPVKGSRESGIGRSSQPSQVVVLALDRGPVPADGRAPASSYN